MKKRKDGRYCKQITIGVKEDGSPKSKYIYGRTIKEVDQAERELRNMMEKGISVDVETVTVEELMEQWLKFRKDGVSDGTYYPIVVFSKIMIKAIGGMKVRDVKLYNLELFISENTKNLNPSSSSIFISKVKNFFRFAKDKELIYRDPSEQIKYPKKSAPTKRMLTTSEKELISRTKLSEQDRCFIDILRYTGMRRGEVLALSTSDIDFKAGTINICKTVCSGNGTPFVQPHTKTNSGMRTIPILDLLKGTLESYCKNRIGMLFTSSTGRPLHNQQIIKWWKKIIAEIEKENGNKPIAKDITPHIFRHTFASDLYDAGIDAKRAQYILGHKSLKTTLEIYTHFEKGNLQMDKMNAYYTPSKTSQSIV